MSGWRGSSRGHWAMARMPIYGRAKTDVRSSRRLKPRAFRHLPLNLRSGSARECPSGNCCPPRGLPIRLRWEPLSAPSTMEPALSQRTRWLPSGTARALSGMYSLPAPAASPASPPRSAFRIPCRTCRRAVNWLQVRRNCIGPTSIHYWRRRRGSVGADRKGQHDEAKQGE